MTLTEKILARAAGKTSVQSGDNIWVNADVLMTHDVCVPRMQSSVFITVLSLLLLYLFSLKYQTV